ncbi:hypothetical protein ELI49_30995 [Rhizobium ruizarguesonis]|uniref:hypothetical protein n=1 Tax=Rhizobium ruizarguesonis TaxID=2081791 RepID=UPI0010318E64|nr:hypothetical protein [Rhizobium ruizarguesonis]TAT96978.1 hypothetical protein ELI49_30995 [Rhizobium ruizarguesonis]TBD12773.1 hypothetical protein ELH20_32970 [Rhizobium ruizarguesonis]
MAQIEDPNSLPSELKEAIRKEVVQKTATYVVAAFIGFLVIAGTGWFLYLKNSLPDWVAVPKGAVAAFDVNDGCPTGWVSFDAAAGRLILGAGSGKGLTERSIREVGGAETHKLTLNELPSQKIELPGNAAASKGDRYDAGGRNYPVVSVNQASITIGGNGDPLSILPPYIALQYCKKT